MEQFIDQFLLPILAGTTIIYIAGATWILYLKNQQEKKQSVLIVDDNESDLNHLGEFLKQGNYEIFQADTREKAATIIENEKLDYAVIDIWLKGDKNPEGIHILKFLQEEKPDVQPIIVSGISTFEEATKLFKEHLKGTTEEIDNMLEKVRDNFISKAGDGNYILKVQEKLGLFNG